MAFGAIETLWGGHFAWIAVWLALVALWDLRTGRIPNAFTFPVLLAGLVWQTWSRGPAGLGDAALGVLLGFLILGWMYALGHLGGGDVKFLMALGAWGGSIFALKVALLSILLGGVLAAVVLAFQGKLGEVFLRIFRFLRSAWIAQLALEFPKVDRSRTLPFGLPIAVAAAWILLSDPLASWILGGHG